MNIEEIKNEVIYSDSHSRLFEITIELTEEISRLHIELVKTKDVLEKTAIKGKMSVLTALQDIISKRTENLSMFFKENSERKEMLSNRQFRIAAEMVLTKEIYQRISELSVMNYKKLKNMKSELKANKLE